jgi:hypothetical protein
MAAEKKLEEAPSPATQAVPLAHVHTMRDEIQADLVRSELDAVGIETFRTSNEGAGAYGRSVQIDIVVRERDAARACRILDALGIKRQVIPLTDPYAHILAVNEGIQGRWLRHPFVKPFVVLWLLGMFVGIGRTIAEAVRSFFP